MLSGNQVNEPAETLCTTSAIPSSVCDKEHRRFRRRPVQNIHARFIYLPLAEFSSVRKPHALRLPHSDLGPDPQHTCTIIFRQSRVKLGNE